MTQYRQFPMLEPMGGNVVDLADRLESVPWALLAPHEAQAQKNHSQTLDQLAARGGLEPQEALAIFHDNAWVVFKQLSRPEAETRLRALVAAFESNPAAAAAGV